MTQRASDQFQASAATKRFLNAVEPCQWICAGGAALLAPLRGISKVVTIHVEGFTLTHLALLPWLSSPVEL